MYKTREIFSSRWGFILTAAGSAVGLGNIWKFPFEVGNGGGAAFVLIYLVCCLLLCFPIMIAEIAIGRESGRNAIGAFTALAGRRWSWVGKLGVLSALLILSYYNVVAGWTFGYFWEIVQGNFSVGENFGGFTADWLSSGIYGLLFIGMTAIIVAGGIKGGIERTARLLMPALLGIMLILTLYAFTLPNALAGIRFYLVPDFSKITLEVVYSAMAHAFFSLSLGIGGLITFGSYLPPGENIFRSAMYITLADVSIALLAGLMLFPFVFSQGIAPDGGPALIFITLPKVFNALGTTAGALIGGLFFLLLVFAALTSTIAILEIPVAYLVDEWRMNREKAVWLTALVVFVCGIPSLLANGASDFFSGFTGYFGAADPLDFMSFLDLVANQTMVPLGGMLVAIFAIHVWKKQAVDAVLPVQLNRPAYLRWQRVFTLTLGYLVPVILGIIISLTVLERIFGLASITP